MKNIAILGDGGWGTAAGLILAANGCNVTIWGYDPAYLDQMREKRENIKFLSGFSLPENISFESDMKKAISESDGVVVAIPTQFLRPSFTKGLGELVSLDKEIAEKPLISLVKGLEKVTMERPSTIIGECLGTRTPAVLSGPSHAEEVAKGLPASVTIACEDEAIAVFWQETFMCESFRPYTSSDVIGVELGGALKNVIAVAVGICEGMGLGDNARSALMTRGLAEMTRFACALGALPETFFGLSGMGDLITTCVSPFGRNRAVGLKLASGKSLSDILSSTEQVAEGVHTCESVVRLAREKNISMPITAALYSILHDGKKPDEAVRELMTRTPKPE